MSDFHDEIIIDGTVGPLKKTKAIVKETSESKIKDQDELSVEEKLKIIRDQQDNPHYLNIDPKDIPDNMVYLVGSSDPARLIELRKKFATFVPPDRHPHLRASLPFESQNNFERVIPIGSGFLMQMEKTLFNEFLKIQQQKVDGSESNIEGLEGGGPANWRKTRVSAF